jgi:TP53 regulating kinase-like protein
VVHGDLTTSNMLVVKESGTSEESSQNIKIYFIDFGLSQVVSNQAEDKAVDLYVLEKALLSTHSVQAKGIFEYILKGYAATNEGEAKRVIERFEAVRLRGRKRSMIG